MIGEYGFLRRAMVIDYDMSEEREWLEDRAINLEPEPVKPITNADIQLLEYCWEMSIKKKEWGQ